MVGTLDKEIIEKFKEFQKKTGKHSELYIEDVEFEQCDIFNDEENIELIGSKKIGSHDELERINDKDGLPVYDASPNILTYIKKDKYPNEVFVVKDNANPDISFASEGNSSAGTNFIIHKDSYFVNNHRTVIKFSNKYYSKYIYYNIFKMKNKYDFKRGYIPSQKELKRLKITIPLPKDLNKFYSSFQIQEAIVEFLEYSFENIERIRKKIDERYSIFERLKKALIPSTFIRDYVKVAFGRYAKEHGINFSIMDVEFSEVNFDNFFDSVTPPKKIKNKDSKPKGIYPVVSQSEGYINGYTNCKSGYIDAKNNPLIIFGDHTTIVKYINFKFFAGADGTKILKPKDKLLPKYAYYQSVNKVKQQGYQRHFQYLKKEVFLIPDNLKDYTSLEIQKIIADFIEYTENRLQKEFDKMDTGYHNLERLHKTYLGRTFSLIDWGEK